MRFHILGRMRTCEGLSVVRLFSCEFNATSRDAAVGEAVNFANAMQSSFRVASWLLVDDALVEVARSA